MPLRVGRIALVVLFISMLLVGYEDDVRTAGEWVESVDNARGKTMNRLSAEYAWTRQHCRPAWFGGESGRCCDLHVEIWLGDWIGKEEECDVERVLFWVPSYVQVWGDQVGCIAHTSVVTEMVGIRMSPIRWAVVRHEYGHESCVDGDWLMWKEFRTDDYVMARVFHKDGIQTFYEVLPIEVQRIDWRRE